MKKLAATALAAIALAASSCLSSDEKLWNDYSDWRKANEEWTSQQIATGQYQKVIPEWNDKLHIYMRWLSDRNATEGNLTPLFTSTVAVKYKGWLYDGTPIDSSYLQVDSLTKIQLAGLIPGWNIAMEQMRVGDRVELIIPYESGYGSAASGAVPPYSTLRFEIDLRDIVYYEVRP